MTQLKCSVENCTYNSERLCAKGEIMVGGHSATASNETCCESFKEESGSARNAVSSHASKNIEVECKAENCTFNEECRCSAQEIGIAGNNACTCAETACHSFECACK